jgi:hypothetical protein
MSSRNVHWLKGTVPDGPREEEIEADARFAGAGEDDV